MSSSMGGPFLKAESDRVAGGRDKGRRGPACSPLDGERRSAGKHRRASGSRRGRQVRYPEHRIRSRGHAEPAHAAAASRARGPRPGDPGWMAALDLHNDWNESSARFCRAARLQRRHGTSGCSSGRRARHVVRVVRTDSLRRNADEGAGAIHREVCGKPRTGTRSNTAHADAAP